MITPPPPFFSSSPFYFLLLSFNDLPRPTAGSFLLPVLGDVVVEADKKTCLCCSVIRFHESATASNGDRLAVQRAPLLLVLLLDEEDEVESRDTE